MQGRAGCIEKDPPYIAIYEAGYSRVSNTRFKISPLCGFIFPSILLLYTLKQSSHPVPSCRHFPGPHSAFTLYLHVFYLIVNMGCVLILYVAASYFFIILLNFIILLDRHT